MSIPSLSGIFGFLGTKASTSLFLNKVIPFELTSLPRKVSPCETKLTSGLFAVPSLIIYFYQLLFRKPVRIRQPFFQPKNCLQHAFCKLSCLSLQFSLLPLSNPPFLSF